MECYKGVYAPAFHPFYATLYEWHYQNQKNKIKNKRDLIYRTTTKQITENFASCNQMMEAKRMKKHNT